MDAKPAAEAFRCGAIAVIGRPNVGKSTLVNALVGERISITSAKPQTTRHRIRAILTASDAQYVFVDTPGFQTRHRTVLNKMMNQGVRQALEEVDAILLVIEAGRFGDEDKKLLALVPPGVPLLLAVNKMDKLRREQLIPFLHQAPSEAAFAEIIPVSAEKKRNLAELLRALRGYLPEQPAIYAAEELTDRSERFLAAERIREKLFRLLGEEVPYGTTVVIEKFETEGRLRRIFASIVIEKDSYKPIVIGAKGAKLKMIASGARTDLERLFGGKIYLEVWVKVRSGWTDDAASLASLGYE